MAKSLDRRQVPVTCITYQAERHWRQDAINRQSFAAIMESFLAERLGGRAEPFDSTLQAASPQVLIGSQHIPGLTQAMSGRRTR